MSDEKKKTDKEKEDERLKEENEKLREENEKLRKENEALQKAKKKIEKDFERYKARHPECVGVKHGKPYHIKEPGINKPLGKSGGKPGHKGHFRKVPEHIDRIVEIPIDICPHCGSSELSENIQEIRTRTIEEIPQCKPVTSLHRIHRRYCRRCKKLVEMPVQDALPGATIGIRTMLFTVWLKIGLRMTIEAIPQLLDEAYGLKISEGEVQNILDQMAKVFEPYYEQMVEDMRKRPARNIDETGWRINGDNVWLWAFITKWEAVYHIANTRGHEAALEILGETPNGVDIHDRFRAYDTLRRKTGFRPQQICWSHLLGDSKEMEQLYDGRGGNHIHFVLKLIFKIAKEFNQRGTQEDVERLKETLERWIVRNFEAIECRTFVKNLLKKKDFMFEFVANPDVDATNNRAERAIRPCVIARKVSGGSRSERGAEIYAILMSIVLSLKLNGKSIMSQGQDIILTSHG
jgi:transposase